MTICRVWSIPVRRIRAFFTSQKDVCASGEDIFSFGTCRVLLTVLPERRIGTLAFPQTRVEFCGDEADTSELYHRFWLNFISAGA